MMGPLSYASKSSGSLPRVASPAAEPRARRRVALAEERDRQGKDFAHHEIRGLGVPVPPRRDVVFAAEGGERGGHREAPGLHVLAVARLTTELVVCSRVTRDEELPHPRMEGEPHELHALLACLRRPRHRGRPRGYPALAERTE